MSESHSDIKCIFYSQFDPDVGPVIRCQYPPNFVTKEEFDKIHHYIITKDELLNFVLTVDVNGRKFIGCSQSVKGSIYPRNYLLFNFCLVLDAHCERLSAYEGIVKKLGQYFHSLEKENRFLSSDQCSSLESILKVIVEDLNETGKCVHAVKASTVLYLKTAESMTACSDILDYEVPVLLPHRTPKAIDLTLRQILPHINGRSHVARIAALADVDVKLVKACLQNLRFFKAVEMVPAFLYSASYACQSLVQSLFSDSVLHDLCAAEFPQIPVADIHRLFSALGPGTRVRDLVHRFPQVHSGAVDISRVIHFGLRHGLIRRVNLYPVRLGASSQLEGKQDKVKRLIPYVDGVHCLDEIACETGLSVVELEEIIENDDSLTVIWR